MSEKSDVEKIITSIDNTREKQLVSNINKSCDSTNELNLMYALTTILTKSLQIYHVTEKRFDYLNNMLPLLIQSTIESLNKEQKLEFLTWLQTNGLSTSNSISDVDFDEILKVQSNIFQIIKYFYRKEGN